MGVKLAMLLLAAVGTAHAGPREALVTFEGDGMRNGRRIVRKACDGVCRFDFRVCLGDDVADAEGSPIMDLPYPASGRGCGETMGITMAPSFRRASSRVVRVRATSRDGRRDRDRLVLRCLRNLSNAGCAQASSSTTSTTLPSELTPPGTDPVGGETTTTVTTMPTTTTSVTPTTSTTLAGGPCRRSGCSGQVCADHDVATSCEWLPVYACFRLTVCESQPLDGQCGWTPTPAFAECLESVGGIVSDPLG